MEIEIAGEHLDHQTLEQGAARGRGLRGQRKTVLGAVLPSTYVSGYIYVYRYTYIHRGR